MPTRKRFPRRAHQARTPTRPDKPKRRPGATKLAGRLVLELSPNPTKRRAFVADLSKLQPPPILTDDPQKAVTFSDRSGAHKWLNRHPQAKGKFKHAPAVS